MPLTVQLPLSSLLPRLTIPGTNDICFSSLFRQGIPAQGTHLGGEESALAERGVRTDSRLYQLHDHGQVTPSPGLTFLNYKDGVGLEACDSIWGPRGKVCDC